MSGSTTANPDPLRKNSGALVLAFDTSGPHCAAALLAGDRVVDQRLEPMARGQAERLMPLLLKLLADCGVTWQDLTAIGVGVGPGNFTGIRIAVSAARGLALGLGIPAVGVSGCEARAFMDPQAYHAIPATKDQVYLCDPQDASAVPQQMAEPHARKIAAAQRRDLIAQVSPERLVEAIARVAELRWRDTVAPPAPLYVRQANAAPSRDLPIVLLD